MTKIEKKFFDFAQKHLTALFFIAATVIGIIAHTTGLDFQSGDFNCYFLPWWNTISQGGLQGLATQVGTYNVPYQFMIFFFTRIDADPLFSYKIISIIFDFILAVVAAMIVNRLYEGKNRFLPVITYTLTLCSITTLLNSSFCAQCDSIYVTFIIIAIYCTMRDWHIAAFIFLGLSFASKFQVVFILPFYLYYYVTNRKYSILHFFIIPVVNIIACLPGILVGRSLWDIMKIYLEQPDIYKQTYMNFPSVYAFMFSGYDPDRFDEFRGLGMVFTILVLGIGLAFVMRRKADLSKPSNFLSAAVWTVFTCLMFMPSMHERYSYLLDVLVLIYVLTQRKRYWVMFICHVVSIRGYCYYLFGNYEFLDIKQVAVGYFALYCYLTVAFAKDFIEQYPENPEGDKPLSRIFKDRFAKRK